MSKEFTDRFGIVYEDSSCEVIRSIPKDLKEYVCDGKALYSQDKKKLLLVLAGTKDYTVPATVKEVETDALSSCKLERLAFEEGTEEIYCLNLREMDSLKEIVIPQSVKYYDYDPWEERDPMMGRPDIVKFMGKKLVQDGHCIYSEDKKELRYVDNHLDNGILIVPNTVEVCRFSFFRDQVEEVRFSKGCERISGWHLSYMNTIDFDDGRLTTIVLPDTIKEVEDNVFDDYRCISHVYVPDDKVDYFRELLPEHLAEHVEPESERKKKKETLKEAKKKPKVYAKDLYPLILKKVFDKGEEGFFTEEDEHVELWDGIEILGVAWESSPHGGRKTARIHLLYDEMFSEDEPEQIDMPLSQVNADVIKALWEWLKDKD